MDRGDSFSEDPASPSSRLLPVFAAATLVALTILVGWLAINAQRSVALRDAAAAREVHTFQVLIEAQRLLSSIQDGETGHRGYLITGQQIYLAPYSSGRATTSQSIERLAAMTADNPVEVANVRALRTLSAERWAQLDRGVQLAKSGHGGEAVALVRSGSGAATMQKIRTVIENVTGEETRLLDLRRADAAQSAKDSRRYTKLLSLPGIAMLVAAGVAITASVRRRDERTCGAGTRRADAAIARKNREMLQSVIDGIQDQIYIKLTPARRYILINRTHRGAGPTTPQPISSAAIPTIATLPV